MVTIIFESHSTTFDNEAGIASGKNDTDLSSLGEKQAYQLGKRYKDDHLDAIFCSDLKRSYRTAEIAFLNRNFPIFRDKRLREIDYGEMNGRFDEEVAREKINRIKKSFPRVRATIRQMIM